MAYRSIAALICAVLVGVTAPVSGGEPLVSGDAPGTGGLRFTSSKHTARWQEWPETVRSAIVALYAGREVLELKTNSKGDAVDALFSAATGSGSRTVYELRLRDSRGEPFDTELDASGKLLREEDHAIPLESVPDALRKAASASWGETTRWAAWSRVRKDAGRERIYILPGKLRGKNVKAYVGEDGTILNRAQGKQPKETPEKSSWEDRRDPANNPFVTESMLHGGD